ncbi:MAG TPA: glycosyltransferase family 4 protein, partial [Acidimicrobiales bacterium]|nr:glycosyltransferase family 4 protein [Acidimicrobiales bacterium]
PAGEPWRLGRPRRSARGACVDVGTKVIAVGRPIGIAVNGSVAPVAPWPSAALRTVAALRSGHYDVVHVHEPLVPGPALAAVLAGPKPLVATFHRYGTDALYRAEGRVLRGLAGRIAAAVAVSDQALATAHEVLGSKTADATVLWNGVDVERWRRPGDARRDDPPVVAFLGRHEPRKGLAVLLEAFAAVTSPARLVACGEGPETEALRRRWRHDERIDWVGRLPDDDVRSLLHRSTVLCAPALSGESFGLVVAEGLAAGVPVLASDIPGYRSALGGAGVLFPAGDHEALATELVRLLGDADERRRLELEGVARADEISMTALASAYEDIYESVGRR